GQTPFSPTPPDAAAAGILLDFPSPPWYFSRNLDRRNTPVDVAPQSTDKPAGTAAEERIAQLTRTLEMTKHLPAEKALDRLFGMVIHQACSSLACEKATLFLYDEQRRELYSTHTVAPLQGLSQIRLSVDKGIVGLAARERRLVHVPDPYSHPL